MTVIAICSGKGGVGKTTVSANLSVALGFYGRVLALDGDVALPNLHVAFGVDDLSSFPDVLSVENVYDAVVRLKLKVGKSSVELDLLPMATSLKRVEVDRFEKVVKSVKDDYDFVLIDVAAGLSKYALVPMMCSDRIYLVVNPEKASILDASRVVRVARASGLSVNGVIVNRYRGERNYVEEASSIGEVVGIVRESRLVRKSWDEGVPAVVKKPNSGVSKDFFNLAKKIVGFDVDVKPYGKLKYLLGWLS